MSSTPSCSETEVEWSIRCKRILVVVILCSMASRRQESRLYRPCDMEGFNAFGWIFSMKTPRQRAGGFSFTAMRFWVSPSQPM